MREIFSILNTRLDQLTGNVGCNRAEDSHNQKKSRCPNKFYLFVADRMGSFLNLNANKYLVKSSICMA